MESLLLKEEVLKRLCYTDQVYGRINKKLDLSLGRKKIESLVKLLIKETPGENIRKIGKNFYIPNLSKNVRVTVNSSSFRVIIVDRIT